MYHSLLTSKSRLKAHLPILESQFSRPTVGDLTKDGYTDFFNFSTGRRSITSLHSIFTLTPRHDLFQYVFHLLYSFVDLNYHKQDILELDFLLAPGALQSDFVWGLVSKDELLSVKTDRWDLVCALMALFSVWSDAYCVHLLRLLPRLRKTLPSQIHYPSCLVRTT